MIEVGGLTKYYGATRAIHNLTFKIGKGQIAGFLGLNGAGKSTALKILAGYLLPTSGGVKIDGVDIVAEPERVRARIGFLPEQPPLYNEMTVEGFLRFLGRLRGMDKGALEVRLPKVMDRTAVTHYADAPIGTLSLGYRRRVGIAQAILHDPALVILDEPISGLDPVQIVQMRELVRSLRGEHTVIISSHILPEVHETCDHLLLLRDGHLAAQGSEEEIRHQALPTHVIEVVVRGDAAKAGQLLAGHPNVKSAQLARQDGDIATFSVVLKGDDREAVAASLVQSGLGLRRLGAADNALESAFLALAASKTSTEARP